MNRVNYSTKGDAAKGRNGDKYMAHVSPGEMILPEGVISEDLEQALRAEMLAAGIDPSRYIVGEGMSINPETGNPEFFKVGKFFKKALKFAVPIAASVLAPGVGSALGLSGLGGALAGGAITGGLGSALTGGNVLSGALMGGAGGGLGSFLGGEGGILGDFFGNSAGSTLDTVSGMAGAQGPTLGSGINGFTSRNLSGLGSVLGGGSGGATSSYASPLLSAALGSYSNDAAEDALLEQQKKNQGILQPFLNANFEPGDLQSDPGYQFQLNQGNQALDRKQAASGNFFSGGALKEAQEFGQGLADTTYNSAYNRWLQSQGQKLGAAGALAGVNDNIGNIKANSIVNTGNVLSGAGAGILGGNGYSNTGALLNNNDGDYLTQLMKYKMLFGR